MTLKFWRLLLIYTLASIIALTGYAFAAHRQLERLRLTAGFESARAFEAAVSAAEGLSETLTKISFVTDEALGKSLCAQAYADALSAETALSILPFDTQEMEHLQGFLGRAGDYAESLCALQEMELPAEHREHLRAYGVAAADFAGQLREMQAKLHEGSILMDTREQRLLNVEDIGTQKLSALLLGADASFAAPEEFAYEGRYSPAQADEGGTLTDAEAMALAAKAANVEPRELREEYDYEGPDGRRCYSAGGLLIGVSRRGLEFLGRSRLVSGAVLTPEQAQEKAEAFFARMGYEDLALYSVGGSDTVAAFVYAPTQDGVMRPDDGIRISIALDDGSVYALDATKYNPRAVELSWDTDGEAALATLPEGVESASARRLIIKSPGGSYLACWELSVTGEGESGASAKIYVDARTGRQCKVELG
ncbi:MAG: germination protein YpeB [Oscillospiraceae bacterium]|nr:germination protein YpeB [Oscillospiraceae bacterium]